MDVLGLCLLLGAFLLSGDAAANPPIPQSSPELVNLAYPNGTRILVELADTPEKRARGLMFREHLANDRGMLFLFEEPGQWTFWMKNTKVPLDILWLGPDKRIADIAENVPGCVQEPCLQYQPSTAALYALEVPAGSVKRHKLSRGKQLIFESPRRQAQ
jgi:uncharacterized protein